jgi:TetR/AcrR family transcriptional regulator, transcriptional repressor for nem operon
MAATSKSREAVKQETRDALLAAGLAAFAAEGLDLPSLDAICARAGFTRGAFYVHFHDRDDFLVAVMEHAFGLLLDALIATGDGAHDLEHSVDRFATAVALAPAGVAPGTMGIGLHRVLEACARSPQLRARFGTMLEDGASRLAAAAGHGQTAGTIRNDIEPHQLGQLLSLLALGVLAGLEAGVPVEPGRARDAALCLLRPSPAPRAKGKRVPRIRPRESRGGS